MAHILVIDDDADIGNLLEETLTAQGYTVSRAYSGTEALLRLEAQKPDLVLLDLMLPGLSGEQLLPQIKGIPVIVVSAKIDMENKVSLLLGDKVLCLELGADDYIPKPFHMKELLARVAVQLRSRASESAAALGYADLTLSGDAPLVSVCGSDIRLTRTEHAILKLLLRNAEQVVTKSAVLDQIAADTPDCTETSLKQHISNLRRKLRGAGSICNIEAVWGIGFRLHKE